MGIEHRSFVSYIDKSREYYSAQGYDSPYRWAAFDDVPFRPLTKPLAESRVAVVTTSFLHHHDSAFGAPATGKVVYHHSVSDMPDTMFTDDLSWDKEETHTDDTESFLRVRDETTAACRGESLHFVVIDDSAGTDDDVGRLAGLADVEVMTPPFNLGHQGAIVYALRSITERVGDDDRIVTMDSDGEDQPADVPRLLAALDADHHTVLALAQRTQRSESITFRAMYFVYRLVFRLLTGTTVRSGNFAAQKAPSLVSTIHHPSFDAKRSGQINR